MRFPFDTTIDRGDDEIEVRVIYDVTPFVPAVLYGDCPQPAEGGEVEIISITRDGKPFQPTQSEEAVLLSECEQRAEQDIADEAAEAAEWRAQERRDRQLMAGFDR
jgi:hypothetical protein